jgi:hypothetical protein
LIFEDVSTTTAKRPVAQRASDSKVSQSSGGLPLASILVNHSVRVRFAVVGSLRDIVVHPSEHNDFVLLAVAEKEPVLLEEFCAKPVLVIITQRAILAILDARGI